MQAPPDAATHAVAPQLPRSCPAVLPSRAGLPRPCLSATWAFRHIRHELRHALIASSSCSPLFPLVLELAALAKPPFIPVTCVFPNFFPTPQSLLLLLPYPVHNQSPHCPMLRLCAPPHRQLDPRSQESPGSASSPPVPVPPVASLPPFLLRFHLFFPRPLAHPLCKLTA